MSVIFLLAGPALVFPLITHILPRRPVLVQSAAALGIGTVVATWLAFLVSLILGFYASTILLVTTMLVVADLVVFGRLTIQAQLKRNVGSWRGCLLHLGAGLFMASYFGLSMWQTSGGATYYAANYTDFPFHLAQVNVFATHGTIPPDHPQAAGCTMAYHFMINFHSACLLKLGMPLLQSVQLPNVLFAAALGILLGAFFRRFCVSAQASWWALILFLFNKESLGNLLAYVLGQNPGGYRFTAGAQPLRSLKGIALFPFFNFDDPIINLFHPQRPMLFGFGLSLALYILLRAAIDESDRSSRRTLALMGLVLGLMPLFHAPSFMVVFLSGILVLLFSRRPRAAIMLAGIVLPLALPQFAFLRSVPKDQGYAGLDVVDRIPALLGSQGVWRLAERPLFWLWVGGVSLLISCIGLLWTCCAKTPRSRHRAVFAFLAAPAAFFLVINVYRFSPNWGDSNKFFAHLMLFLCVFAGAFVHHIWGRKWLRWVVVAGIGFGCVLPYAAALHQHFGSRIAGLFRGDSTSDRGQLMFSPDDWACADWIRGNTPKDAIFLTSDSIVHFPAALSGRRVFMGAYTRENGVGGEGRRQAAEAMFRSGNPGLLREWGVDYVLLSPKERSMHVNETAFARLLKEYDVTGRSGRYRVYSVNQATLSAYQGAEKPTDTTILPKDYALPLGVVGLKGLHPATDTQDQPRIVLRTRDDGNLTWVNHIGFPEAIHAVGSIPVVLHIPPFAAQFRSYIAVPADAPTGSVFIVVNAADATTTRWGPLPPGESRLVSITVTNNSHLTLSIQAEGQNEVMPQGVWGCPMIVPTPGEQPGSETGAIASLPASPLPFVYLSDTTPLKARQDCGELRNDRNFDDNDLIRIRGTVFKKGITTHANADVVYALRGRYREFRAFIGVEDSESDGPASVVFFVKVDDRLVYESPVTTGKTLPEFIAIDTRGAERLVLAVQDAGDGITCDHAVWADAHLVPLTDARISGSEGDGEVPEL